MSKNVESARTNMARFNNGEMEAFLACIDPACVWLSPKGSFIPGTFKGPQEILQSFFMPLGEMFEMTVDAHSFTDAGDAVIIRGEYVATHRATGRKAVVPMVQLATWVDGKLTRHEDFFDTGLVRDIVEAKGA